MGCGGSVVIGNKKKVFSGTTMKGAFTGDEIAAAASPAAVCPPADSNLLVCGVSWAQLRFEHAIARPSAIMKNVPKKT